MVKRFRTFFGYAWAVAALFIVLATFFGMNSWANLFVNATGLKINPWYDGGEVMQAIHRPGYQTQVHKPVFDALIGEQDEGFVQIAWVPAEGQSLPERLTDAIDVTGDGRPDFELDVNTRTNTVRLTKHQPWVLSVGEVLKPNDKRAVRVALKNFH
ncbi:MAG: hypothetical protein GX414_01050 [Acidobacteria bacterium]|nr:hypothetical protein [Acidobacteriota bacterium]